MGNLGNFVALLPQVNEQRGILEWIKAEADALNSAINTAKGEIFLLREYRTRLITDVVTGKLDVREAAAGLREEMEPQEETETTDQEVLDEAGLDADSEEVEA